MFESIEIQNFRSLKQLEIKDLKQFNLIIGDTNVGKTTILESFFFSHKSFTFVGAISERKTESEEI